MNLLQLVLKQMRQRSLSTTLTLVSVVLGVALAIAILLVRRESEKLFGQTDYGYDVLVGAKGSPLQLVMNTVYQIDRSPGNIPYSLYDELANGQSFRAAVRIAVPTAAGDTYKNYRIIGTIPQLFGVSEDGTEKLPPERTLEYRPGKRYEVADGRVFHGRKFEAVVGSDIPSLAGLKIGDKFQVTHGVPAPGQTPDVHEQEWTVVGILAPTKTAADRVLYIPLTSFYAMGGHSEAMATQAALRAGADPRTAAAAGAAVANQPATRPPAATQAEAPGHDDHGHDEHDHDHAPPATQAAANDDHGHDDHDHDHPAPATATITAPAAAGGDHGHDHAADEHGHDHAAPATASSASASPAVEPAHDDHDHHDHADDSYTLNADGTINLKLPPEEWALSAVLVRTRSPFFGQQMMYVLNNRPEAAAVNPARVMREFFATFLDPSTRAWAAVATLVNVVAIVAILVSIYNSIAGRIREIAILRALGATRARILTLICVEAGLIGLIGGGLGLLLGHGLGAAASAYLEQSIGEGLRWWVIDRWELLYWLAVAVTCVLAGLVPALKAYRVPVARNLVAS